MLAVLQDLIDATLCKEAEAETYVCDIANLNSPRQIVVSGHKHALGRCGVRSRTV